MKEPKYKIGDICVAYNDPTITTMEHMQKYNGEECTVIDILVNTTFDRPGGSWDIVPICYLVEFGDGFKPKAMEHELRRLGDDNWVKQKIADLLFPMPVEFVGEDMLCSAEA